MESAIAFLKRVFGSRSTAGRVPTPQDLSVTKQHRNDRWDRCPASAGDWLIIMTASHRSANQRYFMHNSATVHRMRMQSTALDSSRSQLCNDTSTGVMRHQITKWRRLQKVVSCDVLLHIGHYAIWWHHTCHSILDTMLSDDTIHVRVYWTLRYLMTSYMSEYIEHYAIWRHHTCQSITLHYLMTSYMQSIGHYVIWWHHTYQSIMDTTLSDDILVRILDTVIWWHHTCPGSNLLSQFWLATFFQESFHEKLVSTLISSFFIVCIPP